MGVQGLTYDPAGSTNSGNAQSITSDDGSAQVFSDRMACHGQNLNEKHPQLSPQFQNGWTYKSNPNVVFFEADPGVYAYSDDGFKTIKAVDNKAISVIVKNGVPVLDYLDAATYEVPEMMLDPHPGEISSAGTRWNAQGPRQFYNNPRALDYAMAGYTKEADIWEAGHGCSSCHIEHLTNGPVPNAQLDLNRYNRVALLTKVGADVVGGRYDPRNPVNLIAMGVPHPNMAPAADAKPTCDGKVHNFENDPVWIEGQVTRPATPAEQARYNAGMRQEGREIGFVERRDGPPSMTRGDADSVYIPDGPDIKSTNHTHPDSPAIFSGGDARSYITRDYRPDVQHSVTGEKWPITNAHLRSWGMDAEPGLLTTTARQSDINAGAARPNATYEQLKPYLGE